MAMYYENSSEIQGDGLQTLYLMNPNYAAYSVSDSDTQHNMQFFNSAALLPHAPPPPQFVGIPPLSHDHDREQQQDIPAAQNMTTTRHHYNMWGSLDNQPNTTPPRGLSLSLSGHHQAAISGGVISPKQRSPLATEWNGVIMGSKYLKSAQELLDEVVNVGNHLPDKVTKPIKDYSNREPPQTANKAAATAAATATDLTTATRQEIQMKKTKLNIMLDEVEQRCKQYHHEMQMIIAAFEQVAGTGSARSYTQLPLKTILKQFRCLKSTISAQIKALNKSLGEEESLDNNFEGSRLKFVDHDQVRQQRTMQQLGMMHNNAWRPQRGLPERAVSVLRAWLFQHFLHPYPKDSDKQMLAKQTGLTRSQVSNWFINARVRLWKPMVEEMYLEETKNQQQQNASTEPEPEPDTKTTTPTVEMISPPTASVPSRTNFAQLISSLNMENLSEKNPKKARNEELSSSEKYVSMGGAMANMNSRYGMGELDQQLAAGFGHGHGQGQGNSFCLSLALPPTVTADTSFLSHTHTHTHTHRSFENINIESEGGGAYEMLHFQNRKQPFPPQLLPDFVT